MFQISICPGCHRRFLFNLYEEYFCPECGHPLIDRCLNPRCRKTIDRATGDGCPDCGVSYFLPQADKTMAPGGTHLPSHPRRILAGIGLRS
jgi:predicted RNA-binding Zn-ribbon protein involved in translation (DUF1610 family)